jgi:hypothetical protein
MAATTNVWINDELHIDKELDDAVNNVAQFKETTVVPKAKKRVVKHKKKRSFNIGGNGPRPNHELWERKFKQYKDFIITHGRSPQRLGSTLEEQRVYNWRATQITAWNKGHLLPYRKSKLEEIPEWTWSETRKRKFNEINHDDNRDEEVVRPLQKRKRPEISWMGETERIKYVEKISELEEHLKVKDIKIKEYFEIMDHQYNFITVLNEKIASLEAVLRFKKLL